MEQRQRRVVAGRVGLGAVDGLLLPPLRHPLRQPAQGNHQGTHPGKQVQVILSITILIIQKHHMHLSRANQKRTTREIKAQYIKECD